MYRGRVKTTWPVQLKQELVELKSRAPDKAHNTYNNHNVLPLSTYTYYLNTMRTIYIHVGGKRLER